MNAMHIDRQMDWPSAEPGLPALLQVEVTSHCNLRCRLCPVSQDSTLSRHDPGAMRPITESAFVDLAGRVGQVIIAGFGEPLVSPGFLDLLERLDRLGVVCSMSTNGIPLVEKIARRLAALPNLVQINVSIDSPDPDIYEHMRGAKLSRALEGLATLLNAIDNRARVTVSSVAASDNAASLRHFPPLLKALGISIYVVQRDAKYWRNEQESSDDLDANRALELELKRLQIACDTAGIQLALHGYNIVLAGAWSEEALAQSSKEDAADLTAARQCMLPWELPYFDKDGRVFPCCLAAEQADAVLGNIGSESFDAIWHGAAYRAFRLGLQRGSTLPSACRSCAVVAKGLHPLQAYSAELLFSESEFSDPAHIVVRARNTGNAAWTHDRLVRLATSRTRNRWSKLHTPSWISPDRVCTHSEASVAPGEVGSFVAALAVPPQFSVEHFELVVDGVCWLPGTRMAISLPVASAASVA